MREAASNGRGQGENFLEITTLNDIPFCWGRTDFPRDQIVLSYTEENGPHPVGLLDRDRPNTWHRKGQKRSRGLRSGFIPTMEGGRL